MGCRLGTPCLPLDGRPCCYPACSPSPHLPCTEVSSSVPPGPPQGCLFPVQRGGDWGCWISNQSDDLRPSLAPKKLCDSGGHPIL